MELFYNDVDIFDKVRILRCELDQYLSGHVDTLTISFDDSQAVWGQWAPKHGDKISITEEYTKSGNMYIVALTPRNGVMTIRCAAITNIKSGHEQEWKDIRLKQLIDEKAKGLGLKAEYYDVEDQKYNKVKQEGNDLAFLEEYCIYEGCGFMVNDGILRVIAHDYLEKMETSTYTLRASEIRVTDLPYLSGCSITDGDITGKAGDESSEVLTLKTNRKFESISEANRFAKNSLTYANLDRKGGEAYADKLITEFAPGSKVTIDSDYWTDKPVIITHVRHDLYRRKSKLWFRLAKE